MTIVSSNLSPLLPLYQIFNLLNETNSYFHNLNVKFMQAQNPVSNPLFRCFPTYFDFDFDFDFGFDFFYIFVSPFSKLFFFKKNKDCHAFGTAKPELQSFPLGAESCSPSLIWESKLPIRFFYY
jgi:hypothetical protein